MEGSSTFSIYDSNSLILATENGQVTWRISNSILEFESSTCYPDQYTSFEIPIGCPLRYSIILSSIAHYCPGPHHLSEDRNSELNFKRIEIKDAKLFCVFDKFNFKLITTDSVLFNNGYTVRWLTNDGILEALSDMSQTSYDDESSEAKCQGIGEILFRLYPVSYNLFKI
jgi:hypothetical protein